MRPLMDLYIAVRLDFFSNSIPSRLIVIIVGPMVGSCLLGNGASCDCFIEGGDVGVIGAVFLQP